MQIDGFEIVKRAWLYVRQNRFLWPFAFVIALAGSGSQGFTLWVQSPIPRGLTGYSPIHQIGARVTDYARSNWWFWSLLLVGGIAVGLGVLALSAVAQASAIAGVRDIENGRATDFRRCFACGRESFWRFLALMVCYLVLLAFFALPSLLLWWTVGTGGSLALSCLGGLVLGLGFVVLSAMASVILELAVRYVVIEDMGVLDSVYMAAGTFRRNWKDVLLAWLFVLAITLAGVLAMAVLIAILSTPLSWIFTAAYRQHNGFLIGLSILAFLLAWAIGAALSGVFAITGSAVWTLTYMEIESPVMG